MRKVLLLLYGSSGADGTLQPMAYSDADKSTNEVKSLGAYNRRRDGARLILCSYEQRAGRKRIAVALLDVGLSRARPPSNLNSDPDAK